MTTLLDTVRRAAFLEFTEKGAVFTMDDLARRLGMSKKTLYKVVRDKEEIFEWFVEEAFADIKAQEAAIMGDSSLDPVERLKRVLVIMPMFSGRMDYRKIRDLVDEYPAVGVRIDGHLAADWEITLRLVDEAVRAGLLRKVDDALLKEVLLAVMERMLSDDFLERTRWEYEAAVRYTVDLIFQGLLVRAPARSKTVKEGSPPRRPARGGDGAPRKRPPRGGR